MGKHGKQETCKRCAGSGVITVDTDGKDGRSQEQRSCPMCGGSGQV